MFGNLKIVIVYLYVIVNKNRNTETKKCQCNFFSSYLIGLQVLFFKNQDHILHHLLQHLFHVIFKGEDLSAIQLEILICGWTSFVKLYCYARMEVRFRVCKRGYVWMNVPMQRMPNLKRVLVHRCLLPTVCFLTILSLKVYDSFMTSCVAMLLGLCDRLPT